MASGESSSEEGVCVGVGVDGDVCDRGGSSWCVGSTEPSVGGSEADSSLWAGGVSVSGGDEASVAGSEESRVEESSGESRVEEWSELGGV